MEITGGPSTARGDDDVIRRGWIARDGELNEHCVWDEDMRRASGVQEHQDRQRERSHPKMRKAAGDTAHGKLVAEVRKARRNTGGTWDDARIRAEIDKARQGGASEEKSKVDRAIKEARGMWRDSAAAATALTINVGGLVMKLRRAIQLRNMNREGTQQDIHLIAQPDDRMHILLRLATAEAGIILIQETHIRKGDKELRGELRKWMTTGEYEGWGLAEGSTKEESKPGGTRRDYSGVLIWYDRAKYGLAWAGKQHTNEGPDEQGNEEGIEHMVQGHIMRTIVQVKADGTEYVLLNAYLPTGRGRDTTGEEDRAAEYGKPTKDGRKERIQEATKVRTACRQSMQKAAEQTRGMQMQMAIGGDLQVQTREASEAYGGEENSWFDMFCAEHGIESAGELAPTFVTNGPNGREVRSKIDHWLLTQGLMERSIVELGANADSIAMRMPGRGTGEGCRGHNSLVWRLQLDTLAAEEANAGGGEEEWETGEVPMRRMDEEEWKLHRELEKEAVEEAERKDMEGATGFGTGKRRLESIEGAMKRLVGTITEKGEGGSKPAESKATRKVRQARDWRKRMYAVERREADDRIFQEGDICGLQKQQHHDIEIQEALQAERGAARRAAVINLCRRRHEKATGEAAELMAEEATDPDRVATRLIGELQKAKENGGTNQMVIFRAIGRANSSLVGKNSQPRGGSKPGMQAIKPIGGGPTQYGRGKVLRQIQIGSEKLHQTKVANVGGVLETTCAMERAGLPHKSHMIITELREAGEIAQELARAHETSVRTERAWQIWEDRREEREEAGIGMGNEEYARIAKELKGVTESILTDAALDEGMRKFREVQGVGDGGFSGIWVARASRETREKYKRGIREVAADLLASSRELEEATSVETRRRAQARIREAAPRGWTRWLIMLLPKAGKPLDELDKRRDICLQPHGLKLLMNGLKPAHNAAARGVQPESNAGFETARTPQETQLAVKLLQETALRQRRNFYIGFTDKKGFFQSIVRRMQRSAEAECGVPPSVTAIILALHESLTVAYDSGEGYTHGAEGGTGNGQGDTVAPVRSMEVLAFETRAIDWLVVGYKTWGPEWITRGRCPQVWFADDEAVMTESTHMMQVAYTVASMMSRALEFGIGVETNLPTGGRVTKTGTMGLEWIKGEAKEWQGADEMELVDGTKVPMISGWYKHVGYIMEATGGYGRQRRKVVSQCQGITWALSRLGILTAAQFVEVVDTATTAIIAYHGAAAPIGEEACEQIDKTKRKALAQLGHRGIGTSRWLAHAPAPMGMGMALSFPHAAAALAVEMDRATRAPPGRPNRVAAAAATGETAYTWGWRPRKGNSTPAAWNAGAAEQALGEESLVEARHKYLAMAGISMREAMGDGGRDELAKEWITGAGQPHGGDESLDEAGGDASLWYGHPERTFGGRLANLGLATLRDLYGGQGKRGERTEGKVRSARSTGALLGNKGTTRNGWRTGATLTAGEGKEYAALVGSLTAREKEWIRSRKGEPTRRPREPVVTKVLEADMDAGGKTTYLTQWKGGRTTWEGKRPDRTKAIGEEYARAKAKAKEIRNQGGWGLRTRMLKKWGSRVTWLATEAPRHVGQGDAPKIMADARANGMASMGARIKEEEEGAQYKQARGSAGPRGAGRGRDEILEETRRMAGEIAREHAEQVEKIATAKRGAADRADDKEAQAEWMAETDIGRMMAAEREKAEVELAVTEAVIRNWGRDDAEAEEETEMAEARWVAAQASSWTDQLMVETQQWAQEQTEWQEGHKQNAEGVGAAEDNFKHQTARRYTPSDMVTLFPGTLVPGERGEKGKMQTSLKVQETDVARVAGLPAELRPPDETDELIEELLEKLEEPEGRKGNGKEPDREPAEREEREDENRDIGEAARAMARITERERLADDRDEWERERQHEEDIAREAAREHNQAQAEQHCEEPDDKPQEEEEEPGTLEELKAESILERAKRRQEEEDKRYGEVEYVESMSPDRRQERTSTVADRISNRHRELEQVEPRAASTENVDIGMEAAERATICDTKTREVRRLVRRLTRRHGIQHAIAVDGSADEYGEKDGKQDRRAAWGSWDGEKARGGGLPGGVSSQLAELVAMERTLARFKAGDRVLLMYDCQSAAQSCEQIWRSGEIGLRSGAYKKEGGNVLEAIQGHRIRIAGNGENGERGTVLSMWLKAHGGGVAANVYADAIAKSHLAEPPEDVPLGDMIYRPSIYEVAGDEGEERCWCILADKPLRKLVIKRLTKKTLDGIRQERGAESGVIYGDGCDKRLIAKMTNERTAGWPTGPSATGRSQRLRSDNLAGWEKGRFDGQGRRKCQVCRLEAENAGHVLTCKGITGGGAMGEIMRQHIIRASELVPNGKDKDGMEDTPGAWFRAGKDGSEGWQPRKAADQVRGWAAAPGEGEERERFTYEDAERGGMTDVVQIRQGMWGKREWLIGDDARPENKLREACTAYIVQAARSTALAGGQGWNICQAANAIERNEGAIGDIWIAMGQLEAVQDEEGKDTIHTKDARGPTFHIAQGGGKEWFRAEREDTGNDAEWTTHCRWGFEAGKGAARRKKKELVAISPTGGEYIIREPTEWPWKTTYRTRVEAEEGVHIEIRIRLGEKEGKLGAQISTTREGERGYRTTKGEHSVFIPSEGSRLRDMFWVQGWPKAAKRQDDMTAAIKDAAEAARGDGTGMSKTEWDTFRATIGGALPNMSLAGRREATEELKEAMETAKAHKEADEDPEREAAAKLLGCDATDNAAKIKAAHTRTTWKMDKQTETYESATTAKAVLMGKKKAPSRGGGGAAIKGRWERIADELKLASEAYFDILSKHAKAERKAMGERAQAAHTTIKALRQRDAETRRAARSEEKAREKTARVAAQREIERRECTDRQVKRARCRQDTRETSAAAARDALRGSYWWRIADEISVMVPYTAWGEKSDRMAIGTISDVRVRNGGHTACVTRGQTQVGKDSDIEVVLEFESSETWQTDLPTICGETQVGNTGAYCELVTGGWRGLKARNPQAAGTRGDEETTDSEAEEAEARDAGSTEIRAAKRVMDEQRALRREAETEEGKDDEVGGRTIKHRKNEQGGGKMGIVARIRYIDAMGPASRGRRAAVDVCGQERSEATNDVQRRRATAARDQARAAAADAEMRQAGSTADRTGTIAAAEMDAREEAAYNAQERSRRRQEGGKAKQNPGMEDYTKFTEAVTTGAQRELEKRRPAAGEAQRADRGLTIKGIAQDMWMQGRHDRRGRKERAARNREEGTKERWEDTLNSAVRETWRQVQGTHAGPGRDVEMESEESGEETTQRRDTEVGMDATSEGEGSGAYSSASSEDVQRPRRLHARLDGKGRRCRRGIGMSDEEEGKTEKNPDRRSRGTDAITPGRRQMHKTRSTRGCHWREVREAGMIALMTREARRAREGIRLAAEEHAREQATEQAAAEEHATEQAMDHLTQRHAPARLDDSAEGIEVGGSGTTTRRHQRSEGTGAMSTEAGATEIDDEAGANEADEGDEATERHQHGERAAESDDGEESSGTARQHQRGAEAVGGGVTAGDAAPTEGGAATATATSAAAATGEREPGASAMEIDDGAAANGATATSRSGSAAASGGTNIGGVRKGGGKKRANQQSQDYRSREAKRREKRSAQPATGERPQSPHEIPDTTPTQTHTHTTSMHACTLGTSLSSCSAQPATGEWPQNPDEIPRIHT